MARKRDTTLDFLLSLNGYTYLENDGHWAKFEVHLVEPSAEIPHGIRYNLTYHDKHNRRLLGFDNAHAPKLKKKKYGGRKITWDHEHSRERVSNYEFESSDQLLEDFYKAIDRLKKGK